MDFNYLIELAKMNEKKNKTDEDVKYYPSKLSKAKKVERPSPNSEAVKALLDQKEKDKLKKSQQYIKERAELLERRSLDKKNNRKILAMINRTKGANKSVLEEAKDLISVNGEEQCDNDDYGYESELSQQIFNKLTTEYREMPDDDRLKFKKTSKDDIKDIKSRVMDSLKRKHEEDTGVRKRTRKRKAPNKDEFINDGDPYGERFPKESSNFSEKLEEKKVSVPVDKKIKKLMPPPMSFQDLLKVAKRKQTEPIPEPTKIENESDKPLERPLTAKEKSEKEDERLRKLRRMWKLPPSTSSADVQKATIGENSGKSVKAKDTSDSERVSEPKKQLKVIDRSKYFAVPISKPGSSVQDPSARKDGSPKIGKEMHKNPINKKKQFEPQIPSKAIDSDEEEYDSEMDDFIDDGGTGIDISSEIGKIFGYDKSKYRHVDDEDDSSMVASYSQMQQEEKMSAKIGMQEDMEDMEMEELVKKKKIERKMMLTKARRK